MIFAYLLAAAGGALLCTCVLAHKFRPALVLAVDVLEREAARRAQLLGAVVDCERCMPGEQPQSPATT